MALVSILSAIAIPHFNEYKQRAYDLRAKNDLRITALAEEVYFIDKEEYLSCKNDNCSDLPGVSKLSKGVQIELTANEDGYTGTSTHPKGTGIEFKWDSNLGGFVE